MGSITSDTYVCIDCETTGLDVGNDRIIELAAVKFTFSKFLDETDTLIDPEMAIPAESTAIHHITDDMVQGKPKVEDVLTEFLDFVGVLPIVGHGVRFDIDMVSKAAERASIPCRIQENKVLDTLRLARLYGESPYNSLEQLRQHFNIEAEGAHRAMSDVVVNVEVFKRLVENFKTTDQLLERLGRPIKMRKMPLGKHKGRPFRDIPVQYLRWAANKDFDQDLLYSIKHELKRRSRGGGFAQESNPFKNL